MITIPLILIADRQPADGRWISRSEAEALVQAAEDEPKAPHLADFIRLALNTGCRSGELLGFEWRRIDLEANLIHLGPDGAPV